MFVETMADKVGLFAVNRGSLCCSSRPQTFGHTVDDISNKLFTFPTTFMASRDQAAAASPQPPMSQMQN